jgi:hypothetical protein
MSDKKKVAIVRVYLGDEQCIKDAGHENSQKTVMVGEESSFDDLRADLIGKLCRGLTPAKQIDLRAALESFVFYLEPEGGTGQEVELFNNAWLATQSSERPRVLFIQAKSIQRRRQQEYVSTNHNLSIFLSSPPNHMPTNNNNNNILIDLI